MFLFYDLTFLLITLIYLPAYLFRGKLHSGFLARLGFIPKNLTLDSPIWIHAVSVGEAMAARGILEELRRVFPDKAFVVTTVTQTGNRIVRGFAGKKDFITYLPFDVSFIVNKFIKQVRPSLFIALETEIWPNLIWRLHRMQIPAIIINARISDSSFKGYLAIKFLFQGVLNKISLFCVQTETDASRLKQLGVKEEKIKVTGNMKFDLKDYTNSKKDYRDYKQKLGLLPNDRLFVAGSTHLGEEEIILGVYKGLLTEFPYLKILIAPRHPERAIEIEKLAVKQGFNSARVSQLTGESVDRFNPPTRPPAHPHTIFILDTVGQLLNFYTIADIVFVGGSVVKRGGHNILEPAALGKPVIFGPYMFNFRDIAKLFLDNKAAILAESCEDLKNNIEYLLKNPAKISELSEAAKKIILDNQGATKRNLEHILNLVRSYSVEL